MLLALHGSSIMHTNMITDIRIARECGYDALEIWVTKLERYLDVGYTVEELVQELGSLVPYMIGPLCFMEKDNSQTRNDQYSRCKRLCAAAKGLQCSAIQIILINKPGGSMGPVVRGKLARSLADLADIAVQYDVSLAIEPVSFYPGNPRGEAHRRVQPRPHETGLYLYR